MPVSTACLLSTSLYYRLNVVTLNIPALRERKEDLPLLIKSLLAKISQKESMGVIEVSRTAMEYLINYDWPGNVRELENVLERAINFVGPDKKIEIKHLPSRVTGMEQVGAVLTMKEIVEQMCIRDSPGRRRVCLDRRRGVFPCHHAGVGLRQPDRHGRRAEGQHLHGKAG